MTDIDYALWQPVIGLEIHVQLNTASKLFSQAPNRFGDEPNTNISEVCTGQPGALPVLNKEAVRKAVQFGLAVQAKISHCSQFDRKSYFYPDSPRNFQITQFEYPIIVGGKILGEVGDVTKEFTIHHAHLEDDSGMLKHFTHFTGIDYNRAGVPLLEIVSDPCLYSAQDAVCFAKNIRAIMLFLDASNCNMEEGSLRIDVNISVRLKGESELRTKIEIKNMNSFANMELAIESEFKRQVRLYTQGKFVQKGTYRFDLESEEAVMMREKEDAEDYRYFFEPDLPPLNLSEAYIESIRLALPELPREKALRYKKELLLSNYDASILISDKDLCDFFDEALKTCPYPKSLCNWILVEFMGRAKEKGLLPHTLGIKSVYVADLVRYIHEGTVTGRMAKEIADEMVASPDKSPEAIIKDNPNYQPLSDSVELGALVDQVIRENPQSVEDYRAGKLKAFAFLVGQVMKLTQGKASPDLVNKLLTQKIEHSIKE